MSGWGVESGPSAHLAGALALAQPAQSERTQRSLPGPAGRIISSARPTVSTITHASDGRFAGGAEPVTDAGDPDFYSQPWLQALQEADASVFDETCIPFKGNTVRAATSVQQSGVLDRLLVVVATLKRCHSGEAFVRLKDPSGSIGGTLTQAALAGEPDIRQGAVLLLRHVTVLRTPPPRSLSHLCIALDSLVQVIPAAQSAPGSQAAAAVARGQQQLLRVLPALPAPPSSALRHAASFSQQPGPTHLAPQGQQQQQQLCGPASTLPWPALGTAPAQPPSLGVRPPALLRPPQTHAAGRSAGGQPPPHLQEQQQQTSSFAWPSIGGAAACRAPPRQHLLPPLARQLEPPGGTTPYQQQTQQVALSESVNISHLMPTSCHTHGQQPQGPACRDDASSLPGASRQQQQQQQQQQVAGRQQSLPAAAASQGAVRAPAGWVQDLLAEADTDPLPLGLFASQPAVAAISTRPVLAERQLPVAHEQQQQPGSGQAAKRHRVSLDRQAGQEQQRQVLPLAGGAAVFGEVDELELDD